MCDGAICESVGWGNCSTTITGVCNCQDSKLTKNSTFTGENCECCEAGACQKHCFNRFTQGRNKEDMCTKGGTCDCENAQRGNGQSCNVI